MYNPSVFARHLCFTFQVGEALSHASQINFRTKDKPFRKERREIPLS
jgi:hypothetical protein